MILYKYHTSIVTTVIMIPPPPNIRGFASLRTLTDRLAHRAEGLKGNLTFPCFFPKAEFAPQLTGKDDWRVHVNNAMQLCYPQRNYLQFRETTVCKAGESVRCAF